MDVHKNASLTPRGREAMARSVIEGGLSKAAAARRFHTTPKTVAKWVGRFRAEGVTGLQDRSSRPLSSPGQTAPVVCAAIESLRRQRHTGEQIAAEVGVSAATVSRVLKRLGINRLAALEPTEPIRRYERAAPGEIIHIDIKKLGKFNRTGHRITGDRAGQSNTRGIGWEYVHLAIDDHSRLAYSEILPDEKRGSCLRFLFNALRFFRGLGVRVERVMTDNGSSFRSRRYAGPAPAQDQAPAHETLHAQDQRKGRALRPDQPPRMGLCTSLHNLRRTRRRAATLAAPLQLASPAWRHRRKTANQQNPHSRGQPLEAPQ